METSLAFQSHPTEETWEEYAFGRLIETKISPLEEHLLACEVCQVSLGAVIDYIEAMKAGLALVAPPGRLTRAWRFVSRAAGRERRIMWAAALAASCIGLWIAFRAAPPTATDSSLAQVTLSSFRGGGVNLAHAAARRPLDLRIDPADMAIDIPAEAEYHLEVVTASGKKVWNGKPDLSSGSLSVRLPQGLAAGLYWVRVYTRESEISGEFGLLLE